MSPTTIKLKEPDTGLLVDDHGHVMNSARANALTTALKNFLVKCEVCAEPAIEQEWQPTANKWQFVCAEHRHVNLYRVGFFDAQTVQALKALGLVE